MYGHHPSTDTGSRGGAAEALAAYEINKKRELKILLLQYVSLNNFLHIIIYKSVSN